MKWFEDPVQDGNHIRQIRLALAITLGGNLLLAVFKWVAAAQSGSSALKADAWNSVSDVLYSLTLVIGLLLSIRPADMTHPHGHERFEPVTGLVISFSMGWAGIEALRESIGKLKGNVAPIEPGMPLLVLLISAVIKCLMYIAIRNITIKTESKALASTAKDNLIDTLTSVAAAAGILLSGVLHPYADPIAGILLALWILKEAVKTLAENLNYLTGRGANKDELYELRDLISSVPGVLGVHQLFAEYVGTKLRLDVHIDVDPDLPLREVHEIETKIEDLMAARQEVDHIFIHAEPLEEDKNKDRKQNNSDL